MKVSDLTSVRHIIDDNQMFPSEYLDGMAEGYLNSSSEELWFVAEDPAAGVVAIAYCAPERMTNGSWNLLLIAVLKQYQGQGVGSRLIQFTENVLRQNNARILLVETSGMPEYKLTRAFYPQCGYQQIAVIPDYYDQDDDKIVFCKSLISQP